MYFSKHIFLWSDIVMFGQSGLSSVNQRGRKRAHSSEIGPIGAQKRSIGHAVGGDSNEQTSSGVYIGIGT